jgi:hypothetical protein
MVRELDLRGYGPGSWVEPFLYYVHDLTGVNKSLLWVVAQFEIGTAQFKLRQIAEGINP